MESVSEESIQRQVFTMEGFWVKMKQNSCFLPRLVFRCLGISFNSKETSSMYKWYGFIMVTTAVLYPWGNLHLLLHNLDNFDAVANAAFNFIGGLTAVSKIIIMLFNRKRLETIFVKIETIQKKRNVAKWSQNETYSINKKMLVALVGFYGSLLYFYIGTLVERIVNSDSSQWKTPVADVSVFNITYSPNFEIAWAYHVLAVTMISSSYCITDFLVAAIIVDLTLQLKIFRCTIKTILSATQNDTAQLTDVDIAACKRNRLNQNVKEIVINHLSLIHLVEEAEKVCSYLIFQDVTGSVCVICFSLYYASVLPPLEFKAMQSYLEILMITTSLFFICYCGTEISQASESIAEACYETDFVGTDLRFQKSLVMIIRRSQKPVRLTVGKFASLSIPVFVWILRSTYTYFMVLRKSNENRLVIDN